VGLIALTALTITSFHFWQQWRDDQQQLRAQGITGLAMLVDISATSLAAQNKTSIEQILGEMAGDTDIAYVSVHDRKGDPVAERRISAKLGDEPLPALQVAATPETPAVNAERTIAGMRVVELMTPVASSAGGPPIGYVRLGMSADRQRESLRNHLLGALTVVGLLVVVAVIATLLLTRRLVAPMRRLMRAARAVGSGRLDIYVPAKSADELGLHTHTVNHMTQRLAESQGEVANYQRPLEDKV